MGARKAADLYKDRKKILARRGPMSTRATRPDVSRHGGRFDTMHGLLDAGRVVRLELPLQAGSRAVRGGQSAEAAAHSHRASVEDAVSQL